MVGGMENYGVKLKSGKVLWVSADVVDVRDGVVLFCRREDGGPKVLAGFVLAAIDHFGLPEAFTSPDSGAGRPVS